MLHKIDVRVILRNHYGTLYDNRTGRRWQDWCLFVVLPVGLAATCLVLGVELGETDAFLAGLSLISGLLFSLLISLLDKATSAAARAETEGVYDRLLSRIRILREMGANVAYAVLVAVVSTVLLSVGQFTIADKPQAAGLPPLQPDWFTFLVIAMLAHLLLVLVMVVKRSYTILDRELDYASVPAARG